MVDVRAEPIGLLATTTGKVAGFVCGACRCTTMGMFPSGYLGTEDERLAAARQTAVEHCEPKLCPCGAERERNYTVCATCRQQQWAAEHEAKEVAAFERAEKVKASDWTGEYVWSERFEEIFDSISELLGRYEDEGEEPPDYVWECEEEVLALDAEDILHNALEREGATYMMEHIPPVVLDDLKKALDDWAKKHPVKWWVEANRRAVVLITEEG
jgi:hypothetical protein